MDMHVCTHTTQHTIDLATSALKTRGSLLTCSPYGCCWSALLECWDGGRPSRCMHEPCAELPMKLLVPLMFTVA